MIRVAVDAMGGDNAPVEMVAGAVEAVKKKPEIQVLLVGQEKTVQEELSKYTYDKEKIQVVNASEVIATEEPPVNAIRKKKDSSIVVGMNLVKNGHFCIGRKLRSDLSRRTGHRGTDQGRGAPASCTAYSYRKRRIPSDRLRGECRRQGVSSGTVCQNGFDLYGTRSRNSKSKSCHCKYRCGRGKGKRTGEGDVPAVKGM